MDSESSEPLYAPDYEALRRSCHDRTKKALKAVDASLAEKVMPENAESTTNRREAAAILIQAHYRGHLGRKEHVRRLYEQFEREEKARLEKQRAQVEEGQVLIETNRLEREVEEDRVCRRNRQLRLVAYAIRIQRAWRRYKRKLTPRDQNDDQETNQSEDGLVEVARDLNDDGDVSEEANQSEDSLLDQNDDQEANQSDDGLVEVARDLNDDGETNQSEDSLLDQNDNQETNQSDDGLVEVARDQETNQLDSRRRRSNSEPSFGYRFQKNEIEERTARFYSDTSDNEAPPPDVNLDEEEEESAMSPSERLTMNWAAAEMRLRALDATEAISDKHLMKVSHQLSCTSTTSEETATTAGGSTSLEVGSPGVSNSNLAYKWKGGRPSFQMVFVEDVMESSGEEDLRTPTNFLTRPSYVDDEKSKEPKRDDVSFAFDKEEPVPSPLSASPRLEVLSPRETFLRGQRRFFTRQSLERLSVIQLICIVESLRKQIHGASEVLVDSLIEKDDYQEKQNGLNNQIAELTRDVQVEHKAAQKSPKTKKPKRKKWWPKPS
ncbi:IQCJ-SCHIP1 readthrough transcript protein-like isoform X2 [Oscarella lobularis]|uniref:IQCJ-SCHIP1 readthrough transcript protein-like isoform X2 n=1 Tax=Oscarella lobularis TaxID=121494 RepID=UPI0033144106